MAIECGFYLWEGVRKKLLPGDRYKCQVFVCPPLYVRAEIKKNMHSSHRCDNSLCVIVEHLTIESAVVNRNRKSCAAAKKCFGHDEAKIIKQNKIIS